MGHFKLCLHRSVKRGAFLGLALAASAVAAQAQVLFTPPADLSNDGKAGNQQIAIDPSGNINVVWLDNTPGFTAVFFSRSSDGGEALITACVNWKRLSPNLSLFTTSSPNPLCGPRVPTRFSTALVGSPRAHWPRMATRICKKSLTQETSATFTVNTSVVVISASVTISVSYNSTTQSANLDILL